MNRYLILALFLALFLALTACAPDPRREAQAFATRSQAEQDAADREQSRLQDEDLHNIEVKRQEAITAEYEAGMNKIIYVGSIVAQLSVTLIIMAFGIGLSWALIGTGKAWSTFIQRRATVRGSWVPLDYKTRQYPLLPVLTGKNVVAWSDANTGMVRLLDVDKDADKLATLYAGLTRHDGTLGYEARMAKNSTSAGVTSLTSPITEFVELAANE